MQQEFLEWHEKKSNIHSKKYRVYFKERDIWWCSIGQNVGYEQNGKGKNFARPVIVLRKLSNEVFWGLPLTTQMKFGKYYTQLASSDDKVRTVTLSQLRLIDSKRLLDKIGIIPDSEHQKLINAIVCLLRNTPKN